MPDRNRNLLSMTPAQRIRQPLNIRRRALAGVLLGVLQLACLPAPVPRSDRTLTVEFAGCAAVVEGPACVPASDRPLRLWLAPQDLAFEVEGGEILDRVEVAGGERWLVELDERAEALVVRGGGRRWHLELLRISDPEWLTDLEGLFGAGELERVADILATRAEEEQPALRAHVRRLQGRLARARGETESMLTHLRAAVDEFRRAGHSLDAVQVGAELAYGLIYPSYLFADARKVLQETAELAVSVEARWSSLYLHGVLSLESGDWRRALADLEAAAHLSERLGLEALRASAQQVRGLVLLRLGRGAEAAEIYSGLRPETLTDLSPCDRGQLLNNIAWARLVELESGNGDAEDPVPLLEKALELFEAQPCPESDERVNVLTNLALATFYDGSLEPAASYLARARGLADRADSHHRFWWDELEAKIALRRGTPERARLIFQAMEMRARRARAPGAQWRAVAGRAAALDALGRTEEALASFAEAEELVRRQSLKIPIDGGRERFAGLHERTTRAHLDLLLRLERESEALAVARDSQTLALRALRWRERNLSEEQQRRWDLAIGEYRRARQAFESELVDLWQIPADRLQGTLAGREIERKRLANDLDAAYAVVDELMDVSWGSVGAQTLHDGELELTYHPLAEGWVGFARDAGGLRAERLPRLARDQAPAELAERLFRPFAARLAVARTVRIQGGGFLRGVDFHALPLGDEILLSQAAVVYDLDLPRLEASISNRHTALLVVDPTVDLVAARREAEVVRSHLVQGAEGWHVATLQADQATRAAVQHAIGDADLLHIAGHGAIAGREGWESSLQLAQTSTWTVGDVLALEDVPRWVVLSACETAGSTPSDGTTGTMGLAQAFLIAGSAVVVATVRPVADEAAAALMAELYSRWTAGISMPEALRQAQLEVRRQRPESDWASFRVFES